MSLFSNFRVRRNAIHCTLLGICAALATLPPAFSQSAPATLPVESFETATMGHAKFGQYFSVKPTQIASFGTKRFLILRFGKPAGTVPAGSARIVLDLAIKTSDFKNAPQGTDGEGRLDAYVPSAPLPASPESAFKREREAMDAVLGGAIASVNLSPKDAASGAVIRLEWGVQNAGDFLASLANGLILDLVPPPRPNKTLNYVERIVADRDKEGGLRLQIFPQ